MKVKNPITILVLVDGIKLRKKSSNHDTNREFP